MLTSYVEQIPNMNENHIYLLETYVSYVCHTLSEVRMSILSKERIDQARTSKTKTSSFMDDNILHIIESERHHRTVMLKLFI